MQVAATEHKLAERSDELAAALAARQQLQAALDAATMRQDAARTQVRCRPFPQGHAIVAAQAALAIMAGCWKCFSPRPLARRARGRGRNSAWRT